ncbi:uncharacterized protein LOC109504119 isoform X2 [Harpegnathos saltator]|uniref:uncharacterized protein LOC109504119 isoform X2 n=1 Tax=Harpegnathos saltator TaxID=610380 RepID=UPI000DBED2E8|nr:uncharacterized protein LOC109504119 isoform X2 [Harpegnathos saltator]
MWDDLTDATDIQKTFFEIIRKNLKRKPEVLGAVLSDSISSKREDNDVKKKRKTADSCILTQHINRNDTVKVIHVIKLAPEIIISDFEKAERKALQTIFPRAKVIGCFFHYSQALIHNAKKHNILKGDKKESGWGALKLLISLAFLPEDLIEGAFEIIYKIIFNDCKYLRSFFHYYRETWLNSFKPRSFCVFQQLHRTNNISDRHNRELRESLKQHS